MCSPEEFFICESDEEGSDPQSSTDEGTEDGCWDESDESYETDEDTSPPCLLAPEEVTVEEEWTDGNIHICIFSSNTLIIDKYYEHRTYI